jgi:signal transduction histidine kinase
MRARLRLFFVLLVLAPLAALAALGLFTARGEEARAAAEVRGLLERKLEDLATMLGGAPADLQRELLAATEALPADADELRALGRRQPRLRRMLVVAPGGRLLFPPPEGPSSEEELRFVRDSRFLWDKGGALARAAADEERGGALTHGWQPLPDGEGMGLLFWRRTGAGDLVAVALPGAAILAELVARLPATSVDRARGAERIALHDPSGRLVYQWGAFQPGPDARPLVDLSLRAPLGGWRLAYLGPAPARGRAALGIGAGLAALAAVVVAAGVWIYRESTRELRQAAERVSFVNQVSHELKTPLTNVRMYAELLEDHVDPHDDVGRRRLGIVVAESQRLGRLITNVLTFSRAEKGRLSVQPAPGCVDEVVGELLAQFAPGFEASGITARFHPGAPHRVRIDADALAQILGNLLGNVEKYAARGELLVSTHGEPPLTRITIADEGPGIPAAERERVFEPFVRLGSSSHEGVPGTGIGLGIARDLARKHGGDLRVVPSEQGACFELTLTTEEIA